MRNEILALLGKEFMLTTGYDGDQQAFIVKVNFKPKSAYDMSDLYVQKTIFIHDIVYATNTDALVAAVQSCIGQLETKRAEETYTSTLAAMTGGIEC
jgi:predicted RNA-binding protein associated with RNAse of E/G family